MCGPVVSQDGVFVVLLLTFDVPGLLGHGLKSVYLDPDRLNAFGHVLVGRAQSIEPIKALLVVIQRKLSQEMAVANFAKSSDCEATTLDRLEIAVLKDLVKKLVGQC